MPTAALNDILSFDILQFLWAFMIVKRAQQVTSSYTGQQVNFALNQTISVSTRMKPGRL